MVEKRFNKLGLPDIERFENYLPTAFSSELSLLQKVNKVILALIESNKLTNEMVVYLNEFIETFDEKLYKTTDDILEKWFSDGKMDTLFKNLVKNLFDEVDKKIDKDGIEQVLMKNLSEEVKLALTGGSVAVVGNDTVIDRNVVNNSLTVFDKAKDTHTNTLVYNSLPSEIEEVDGYYNLQGLFTASTQHKTTKLLPLEAGLISLYSHKKQSDFSRVVTYWDKDGYFISGEYFNQKELKTVPYNATSFRMALRKEDDDLYISIYESIKTFNDLGIDVENQNLNTYGVLPQITIPLMTSQPFLIFNNGSVRMNPVFIGERIILNNGTTNIIIYIHDKTFVTTPYNPINHAYFYYSVKENKIIMKQSLSKGLPKEDYINLGIVPTHNFYTHGINSMKLSYEMDGRFYEGNNLNKTYNYSKVMDLLPRGEKMEISRTNKTLTLKKGLAYYAVTSEGFINIANSFGETINYSQDDVYDISASYNYVFVKLIKDSITSSYTATLVIYTPDDMQNGYLGDNLYYVGVIAPSYEYLNAMYTSDTKQPTTFTSSLKDKNVVCNGDSIMVSEQTRYNETFKSYMALSSENLGFNLTNYAISSTTVAVNPAKPTERTPLVARINAMSDIADLVIICVGTNDWKYSWTEIGTMSDRNETTFYGAFHLTLERLKAKYGAQLIKVVLPIKRGEYQEKNLYELTLEDYCNIIKEVCDYHSIEFFDGYKESMMNPHIVIEKDKYLPDGTHPNKLGHELMEKWLSSKIGTLKV